MAIFGNLELENIIAVGDKTRLKATKSFISKDEVSAITLVRIEPEAGAGFVDVTGNSANDWFLDWSYAGATRTVTVTVEITAGASGPDTFSDTIEVLTEVDDALFSSDKDLTAKESDILNYVEVGRNSFKKFHREAQTFIIDHFNMLGITDNDGAALTKTAVVDVLEVKKWSERLTLWLIYDDLSNSVEDNFAKKASNHLEIANRFKNRESWRLDLNGDAVIESNEGVRIGSVDLVRA